MKSAINLSIFLLRAGRENDYERDIGDDRVSRSPLAPPMEGYFSALPSAMHPPGWAAPVSALLAPPAAVSVNAQSPGGLLLIRRNLRTFILTFGHAWTKLRSEWLEHDFGRRVVLNSMKIDSLIELRTEQVFARWHLASERAPRGSSVDSFGVEFDRDMVSVVEGLSSVSIFGRTIRGGTSLRVHADLANIGDILDRALVEFGSAAYKKRWPEIDNLTAVSDKATIATLEQNLDVELAAGKGPRKVILFTPLQRRGEALTASSFVIGRFHTNAALTPYLTFGTWQGHAKKYNAPLTVAGAKVTPIHVLDEASEELSECSVYECFGYEGSLAGKPYVLSSGIWYEVIPTFLNRINKTVKGIRSPSKSLSAWNQMDDEGTYNAACAKADKTLLHFDKKNVWYGGGQSRFEFCDLMHLKSRRLYFVKVPSKSSGMSHLVEQTRRTAELFFGPDLGFRAALKAKIRKLDASADTSWTTSRPDPRDWKLCFVSMGKSAMELTCPWVFGPRIT